jgi:hypothetical protein
MAFKNRISSSPFSFSQTVRKKGKGRWVREGRKNCGTNILAALAYTSTHGPPMIERPQGR